MPNSTAINFNLPTAAPGSLDVQWIHGSVSAKHNTDPDIQVHAYNEHTFILRQNMAVHVEAPFMFLLFGNERAILLDTGATRSHTFFPLRQTVDALISQWLTHHPRSSYPLIVAHTHLHRDHFEADSQFTDRPNTTVVGKSLEETIAFYGFQNWPVDAVTFDLGDRFHGVFSTSASLNHLMTLEDLTQVFERVHASLKEGGIFVFDLNHPEQLERWWYGQPTEGALSRYYAWMITPHYDASLAKGDFQVTIFHAPAQVPSLLETLLSPIKRLFYKVLSLPRFIGLRLKLIQNMATVEPQWKRRELTYPIKGHNLDHVKAALAQTGFKNISIQTIDGATTIATHHSAHFICTKPSLMSPSRASSHTT